MEEEPKIEKENIVIEEKESEAPTAMWENINAAIKAETEKNPEQIKLIEKVNEYLDEELKELDIKRKSPILPEKVHLIPDDVYKKFNLPPASGGLAVKPENDILFNENIAKIDKSIFFFGLMHEGIHLVSFEKYLTDKNTKEENILGSRIGYQTTMLDKEKKQFEGLNEMITSKITYEIIAKHRKELKKEFKISKDLIDSGDTYLLEILDLIINEIAVKNDEKKEDVWMRFKKGLFTGEMMHLRDIERACGKGALRILAAYYEEKTEENAEFFGRVVDYFITKDEAKREKIAEEILSENEFKKYKQQRKE